MLFSYFITVRSTYSSKICICSSVKLIFIFVAFDTGMLTAEIPVGASTDIKYSIASFGSEEAVSLVLQQLLLPLVICIWRILYVENSRDWVSGKYCCLNIFLLLTIDYSDYSHCIVSRYLSKGLVGCQRLAMLLNSNRTIRSQEEQQHRSDNVFSCLCSECVSCVRAANYR